MSSSRFQVRDGTDPGPPDALPPPARPEAPTHPPQAFAARVGTAAATVPLGTATLLGTITLVFVFGSLAGPAAWGAACFRVSSVLFRGQVIRALTAPLLHLTLLHLAFNAISLVVLGSSVERAFGTLQFLWIGTALGLLGDVVFSLIAAALLAPPMHFSGLLEQCSMGLSGILFALLVIDVRLTGVQISSVYGLINVPARALPYVLLIVCQIVVPNASFFGHLSGVLAGELCRTGLGRWLVLPAPVLSRFEAWAASKPYVGTIMRCPSFVPASSAAHNPEAFFAPPPAAAGGARGVRGPGAAIYHVLAGLWQPYPAGVDPRAPIAPPPGVSIEVVAPQTGAPTSAPPVVDRASSSV